MKRHVKIQRRLMAAAGVAAVVLGLVYIAWPTGHIPPYDANLVRLAETDLQGYCAGDSFWKSGGEGSANLAAQCRKQRAQQHDNKPNIRIVQKSFCQAIVDNGWEGTLDDCLGIMTANQYWPTYDGAITNQWNRARKYPLTFGTSAADSRGSGSRTGGTHGGGTREDYTDPRSQYPYP